MSEEEVILCCRCKKSVAKSELRDHLSQHLLYNRFQCRSCKGTYVSLDKFRLHIQLSLETKTPCLSLNDSAVLDYPDATKEQELRWLLDACSTRASDETRTEKEKESPAAVTAAPRRTPTGQHSLPNGKHAKQPRAYKSILGSLVPRTRNTELVRTGHPEKHKTTPPSTQESDKRMKTTAEESLTNKKEKNVGQPVQKTKVQEPTRKWEPFKIHLLSSSPTTKKRVFHSRHQENEDAPRSLRQNDYSPCQKCGELVYRTQKRAHCKTHVIEEIVENPAARRVTFDHLLKTKRDDWFPNTRWSSGDIMETVRRESLASGGVQKKVQFVFRQVAPNEGSSLRAPQSQEHEQLTLFQKRQFEVVSVEQQSISHVQPSEGGEAGGETSTDCSLCGASVMVEEREAHVWRRHCEGRLPFGCSTCAFLTEDFTAAQRHVMGCDLPGAEIRFHKKAQIGFTECRKACFPQQD